MALAAAAAGGRFLPGDADSSMLLEVSMTRRTSERCLGQLRWKTMGR